MLWDRGDANGYAHRMTDDPAAEHPAAQGADERRLRRSPGHHLGRRTWRHGRSARLHTPDRLSAAAGRASTGSGESRGSTATRSTARRSSTGTAARSAPTPLGRPGYVSAPTRRRSTNTPNRSGQDPHELPRRTPAEQQMVSDFLQPDGVDHRHLQRRALLRLHVQRAVAARSPAGGRSAAPAGRSAGSSSASCREQPGREPDRSAVRPPATRRDPGPGRPRAGPPPP